jgi:aspartyl-tRNA(Asn)/glutamyl-tRNA(Gln) amidotransferase subunit C
MLTKQEVYEVAALARIELTEEEAARFQKELSAVLELFSELETVDTDDLQPIGHITGRIGEARSDLSDQRSSHDREMIRKNFPEGEENYLKVRSVF